MFQPSQPHNNLPRLPPDADVESRAILKRCIEARAALAGMNAAAALIPNPAVLVNSLPVFEAQASSAIENIVTTTDRLFQFGGTNQRAADPATKEALRYRTALNEGFDSLRHRPLSIGTAVQICRTITGTEIDIRATPGTALRSELTKEVVYTPPDTEQQRLRDLMADWERYAHAEDTTDPLIKMAILHYQFEAIHPFADGNGRTGRILNVLYLIERQLIELPILYLSRYFIRTKDSYYSLLLEVTRSAAWEQWILYVLSAVQNTAEWTRSKVQAIRAKLDETAQTMRTRLPKIYSRELAEIIFEQPYCRIGNVVEAGIARRQTAAEYLKALAAIGLLEERKFGREKLFINPGFLGLLSG